MKVVVIGAGGLLGSRVLQQAVLAGHQAMAFVRSKERLRTAIGEELLSRVAVIEGDAGSRAQLVEALRGQEAAVQAAGYIGASYEEGRALHQLVVSATEAAAESLVGPRRLWVLGGAGALDLPGRPGTMLIDVPGFPPKYRIHKDNFAFLSRPEHSTLDWSFACPGAMLGAPAPPCQHRAGGATAAGVPPARVTVDELPVPLPGWAALLPTPLLLPALAAIRGQLVGPSYEEVAGAIVAHLAPGGPLRHRRVGFAAAL